MERTFSPVRHGGEDTCPRCIHVRIDEHVRPLHDPISLAGVVGQLRIRPEIRIIDEVDVDEEAVAVVVVEQLDDEGARVVRALRGGDHPRIVLVATSIDESTLVAPPEAASTRW